MAPQFVQFGLLCCSTETPQNQVSFLAEFGSVWVTAPPRPELFCLIHVKMAAGSSESPFVFVPFLASRLFWQPSSDPSGPRAKAPGTRARSGEDRKCSGPVQVH